MRKTKGKKETRGKNVVAQIRAQREAQARAEAREDRGRWSEPRGIGKGQERAAAREGATFETVWRARVTTEGFPCRDIAAETKARALALVEKDAKLAPHHVAKLSRAFRVEVTFLKVVEEGETLPREKRSGMDDLLPKDCCTARELCMEALKRDEPLTLAAGHIIVCASCKEWARDVCSRRILAREAKREKRTISLSREIVLEKIVRPVQRIDRDAEPDFAEGAVMEVVDGVAREAELRCPDSSHLVGDRWEADGVQEIAPPKK